MKSERNTFNLLFVCGRNKWRSPTAVKVFGNIQAISVKSAGVSPKSKHQISENDILWADLIIVMELSYRARILGTFRHLNLPPIESLNILDEYEFMNIELIDELKQGMQYLSMKYKIPVDFGNS